MRVLLILIGAVISISVNADILNYEAEGNLKANSSIGCISINELSSKNSPADIYIGISECISKNNFDKASKLYFVTLAYSKYDTLRVLDRSSHQATSVLRLNHLGGLNEEQKNKLQTALKETGKNKPSVCESIKTLGRPAYHPTYMIQHGIGAFAGQETKDGLVADFNPAQAWNDVLSNYVKCPE